MLGEYKLVSIFGKQTPNIMTSGDVTDLALTFATRTPTLYVYLMWSSVSYVI